MPDKRTQQDRLIEALYDLALDPNSFDSFTESWEQYIQDNQLNSTHEADVSERLARHFGRAFQILEKFGRENISDYQSIDTLVENRPSPSMVMAPNGRLLSFNDDAKKLFNIKKNVEFAHELVHKKSSVTLNNALSKIAPKSSMPLMVLLQNNQPALMHMQRLNKSDIIIADIMGSTWEAHMHSTLKSMYGLTGTECSVAAQLYQGLTINEIAEQDNRAIETVRKHTKSLLKKTQTHSQPKLMRLLTSLNFAQTEHTKIKWANTKCANHSLTLDDGRKYAYYDSGPKNKNVILVLHGVLHDPELPDVMHAALTQAGYRIIGPSRAWFGESSPPVKKGKLLDKNADDVITLLDHLNIDSAILLGNMSGAVHAYVTAARYPQRIKRIINIAGMVPLTKDNQIQSMPKGVRAVVKTAKYFPQLLPFLMRTALALIDNGDIRKLFETTYRSSAIDIAATKRDDVFQRLHTGYRFASHNGYAAYTEEGLALAQDLSSYLKKVQCTTCLIHGVFDGINTVEAVQDLSRSHIKMHLTVIEDAGHLLMYTNAQATTNALLGRLIHT